MRRSKRRKSLRGLANANPFDLEITKRIATKRRRKFKPHTTHTKKSFKQKWLGPLSKNIKANSGFRRDISQTSETSCASN